MAKIIGNAKIGHVKKKGDEFVVLEGFRYSDEKYCIFVLGGWVTDGATVPRVFWWLFPPIAGKYLEAAILHDALYRSQILTRNEADIIFLKALKSLGVNSFKRWTMYLAVRMFGWIFWNRNKKKVYYYRDFVKITRR